VSGLYGEVADLKRRIFELERRLLGEQPPTAPPQPELGTVSSVSPLTVDLSDGTSVQPSLTLGAAPAVNDEVLVVWPDGDSGEMVAVS
jgi:hypothetical protein